MKKLWGKIKKWWKRRKMKKVKNILLNGDMENWLTNMDLEHWQEQLGIYRNIGVDRINIYKKTPVVRMEIGLDKKAGIYQPGINLELGQRYKLKVIAKVSSFGNGEGLNFVLWTYNHVFLQDNMSWGNYDEINIPALDDGWYTYEFEFTCEHRDHYQIKVGNTAAGSYTFHVDSVYLTKVK